MIPKKIVVDTNVIVSAALWPYSTPGHALRRVIESGIWLMNSEIQKEFLAVMSRAKFDRYVLPGARRQLVSQFLDSAEMVPTVIPVTACRDARDNHVLEAAVNGSADLIVTGDEDLLALHPFHDIQILTPTDYLK